MTVPEKAPLFCSAWGVGAHGCQDRACSCLACTLPSISQKRATSSSHRSEGSAGEGDGGGPCRHLWGWGQTLGQQSLARLPGPGHGSKESAPCAGLRMRLACCRANSGSAFVPTMNTHAQNHLKRFSGTLCADKHGSGCHPAVSERSLSPTAPPALPQAVCNMARGTLGNQQNPPHRPPGLQLPAAPARPAPPTGKWRSPAHSATIFPLGASTSTNQRSAPWGSQQRSPIKKN